MKVIPPLEITDSRLTSSTISEPDTGETAWSGSSVAYALGDQVIRTTTHRIYECVSAHTSAASPVPENNTAQWLEIGPTNRWAMFDTLRNTASQVPSSMTIVLTPGQRIDSLALLGVLASSVTITMTSDGVPVYSRTVSMILREVADWYDYFFRAFSVHPSLALFDLPPITIGVITITLTASAGNVACGACVIGQSEYIGEVQYEAENDVLNFSTVTRDFAGGVSAIVQRRNVPKTLQSIFVDKSRVNRIRALRDSLGAVPAVWAGLDNSTHDYFEAVLILGFYKRFSINLRYPDYAVVSLELEEI